MSTQRRDLSRMDLAKRGLVALVAVALLGGLVWARDAGFFGGPEFVEAVVADAGGSLTAGADVKVRGVIVGTVTEVDVDEAVGVRLKIAMTPEQLRGVPADVKARILPATVFGTSYVDLDTKTKLGRLPPAERLQAGAVIPPDERVGTIELQQALDDIDRLVTALGPAELASAIGSTAQALDGRGAQIGQIIDQASEYLGKLNPKLPLMTANARKLADNIEVVDELAPQLFTATKDALVIARTVVTQQAAIVAIIGGGTAVAERAGIFMGENKQDLMSFLNNAAVLLDAVYDNRKAAITDAFATNRLLEEKLTEILTHGFGVTVGRFELSSPGRFYTSKDCPRYGQALGGNCRNLARAGVSQLATPVEEQQ